MRYLLATPEYPPDSGGVARYLGVLAQNQEGIIVASPHGPIKLNTSWCFWPRWLPLVWQLPMLLKKYQAEALIISHVLPFGYAALIARMMGYRYSVICHGLDLAAPLADPWKRFWTGVILRGASRVIANGAATAELISRYNVQEEKVRLVHPPLSWDPSDISEQPETDFTESNNLNGKQVLLFAGRLVPRKGADIAVRAMAKIKDRFPEAVLLVVGDGPMRRELQELAEHLRVQNRLLFTGHLPETELRDAYRAAEIVLYPSLKLNNDLEGYGIGAADAGLFGKPVIASQNGGLAEAVGDGGLLITPGDPEALETAIIDLLSDSRRAVELGEAGRRLASERTHRAFRQDFFAALQE